MALSVIRSMQVQRIAGAGNKEASPHQAGFSVLDGEGLGETRFLFMPLNTSMLFIKGLLQVFLNRRQPYSFQ